MTRAQAEKAFRRLQQREAARKRPSVLVARPTVDLAATELHKRLAIEGARTSYLENCESMQRPVAQRVGLMVGMTRLLTAQEVAERLGVTTAWVWAQTRAGRFPHVQLGRYVGSARRRSRRGSGSSSGRASRG